MSPSKDNLGTLATPDEFTLSQATMSMLMDMDQETREATEKAAKQAIANPEDFVKYVIISLLEHRKHIDTVIGALVRRDILRVEETDSAPSA